VRKKENTAPERKKPKGKREKKPKHPKPIAKPNVRTPPRTNKDLKNKEESRGRIRKDTK